MTFWREIERKIDFAIWKFSNNGRIFSPQMSHCVHRWIVWIIKLISIIIKNKSLLFYFFSHFLQWKLWTYCFLLSFRIWVYILCDYWILIIFKTGTSRWKENLASQMRMAIPKWLRKILKYVWRINKVVIILLNSIKLFIYNTTALSILTTLLLLQNYILSISTIMWFRILKTLNH